MRFASFLALGLVLTAAGAQTQTSPNAMSVTKQSAKPDQTASLPLTDAIVERVLRESGEIVLEHEDLPNLAMPAMTMAFDVGNKKMLDAVKPGDKVRFQAEIVKGRPTITHMELANRPARARGR
ncbi:Cu and Ag efflux protein CusF [Variovorax sp. CF079]|uniref:copper-binding protein n=1 Tax=Variovorax sp. CF079 TaxID=1882774 RepID=UPI00088E320A|nr:copper-binding protein [Variovorax sp. CF079]SDC02917.1 Cu and Ag efflux protein CusF [Variovorax sp. CF079]